jgi:hypothetical protein
MVDFAYAIFLRALMQVAVFAVAEQTGLNAADGSVMWFAPTHALAYAACVGDGRGDSVSSADSRGGGCACAWSSRRICHD